MTEVVDLRTGEAVATYSTPPAQAVVAAYAQFERGDFHTWEYQEKYAGRLVAGRVSIRCGDYCAMMERG